jgi:hypothetical protein
LPRARVFGGAATSSAAVCSSCTGTFFLSTLTRGLMSSLLDVLLDFAIGTF